MAVAGSGEEIVLAQGDYRVAAAPSSNPCTGPRDPSFDTATALGVGNRYIHGEAGRPRPRLIGDAATCVVLNVCCNGSAEHLEVISNNTTKREAAAVLIDGNGTVSDVVTGGPNGTVHMRNFATLINSVVGARPQDGAAVFAHFGAGASAVRINNATALGDVVADSVPLEPGVADAIQIVCVNSIATGKFLARQTNSLVGSMARIDRDHCAGSAQLLPNAAANNNVSSPDLGGNLAGATFVPGDYHQMPGSPTRDRGRVDSLVLTKPDIDGGSRQVGTNPDIGADEFGSASAMVDTGLLQSLTGSSAVVAGTVFPGGVGTSAYVEYGPTTGYGAQSAPLPAGESFGAVALTFALSGMTVNSPVYHYRLVGTNGNARGEDRTIVFADADGDGFFANVDCNDGNAAISPGRGEIADNGLDDDCSGADAVNLDRDADAYPRPLDCDDANPAISPGAVDVPGNAVDEDCKGGNAPYPTLASTIGYTSNAFERYTLINALFVRRARAGSTIHLRCSGRGCPFKAKRITVKRNAARLSLKSLLRNAKLKPKAKLRISITFPGTIGLETTLTIRSNERNPVRNDRCLVPGAARSIRCST